MPTVTGTHDIINNEEILYIYSKAEKFFSDNGFTRIETPILEYSEVFRRTLGETSDIVIKQMYEFDDKDGKRVVLRPEGTAPVVRAYIENGFNVKESLSKLYYIGPMFRRERPQKGRYRQFNQIGCEILGASEPIADAYLIFILSEFFRQLGIEHSIQINSIGCKKCRPTYTIENVELCDDCKRRKVSNPLRILDCKEDRSKIPLLANFLCEDCSQHYKSVKELLSTLKINFVENPYIVRGLDYYTKTVFEVFAEDEEIAISAGGRYDDLVRIMGGKDTPALGFAIGVERILNLIKFPKPEQKRIFIVYLPGCEGYALEVFSKLQREGLPVEIVLRGGSLKSQMRFANSKKSNIVIITGEEEKQSKSVTLKNMETGEQKKLLLSEAVEQIKVFLN
mgnify:CR=1 FL=1